MSWDAQSDTQVFPHRERCLLPWTLDTRYSLLAEGGAQRTAWALGVLLGMRLAGLRAPAVAVGASAGVVALLASLAMHPSRGLELLLRLYEDGVVRPRLPPFDTERLVALLEGVCGPGKVEAALQTANVMAPLLDAQSGHIEHTLLTASNWRVVVAAACAVPVLNARVVRLEGHDYLDGSIGLPVEPIHAAGLRAVAVLTRSEPRAPSPSSRVRRAVAAVLMPGVASAARNRWIERGAEDERDRAVVLGRSPAPVVWHSIAPSLGQVLPSRLTFDRYLLACTLVGAVRFGIAAAWGPERVWPDVVALRFARYVAASRACEAVQRAGVRDAVERASTFSAPGRLHIASGRRS